MLDFHRNHKLLVGTAIFGFLMLSTFVALVTAFQNLKSQPLLSMETFSEEELKGLQIYVREKCKSCHTQQERNVKIDNTWGNSLPFVQFITTTTTKYRIYGNNPYHFWEVKELAPISLRWVEGNPTGNVIYFTFIIPRL